MQKYKLIKLYPNSPPLGTEVNYSETHQIYNTNGGNYYTELPKHQVENLPEFWEEVKEKEFEILELSYEDNFGKIIFKTVPEDKLHLYTNCCKITKVKRLSDGEIFSLGDLIDGLSYNKRVIIGFEIEDNSLKVLQEGGFSKLQRIKHSVKPLFLDELGNEVFEGEKIYFVEIGEYLHKGCEIVNSYKNNYVLDNDFKFFKNKADAEKFISDNKPTFSRKQVLDALEWGKYEYYRSIASTEWFRVVKEKLGL